MTARDFAVTPPAPDAPRRRPSPAPKGWEPGVAYESSGAMTVTTTSTAAEVHADPSAWRDLVAELGLEVPRGYRMILVEAKYDPAAWGRDSPAQDKATTRAVWRYRFRLEPDLQGADIEELVKRVGRRRPAAERPSGESAFLIAMGDTQIGKVDGDGPDGTVDRVLQSIEGQKKRLKTLRRLGESVGDIYLTWLGDCIEGFVSQGGANSWRTVMTLTEQVRVVRRLMLHQIEELAPLADRLVFASVPGNHDDAVRIGGKGVTTYTDSWAIEAAVQVADAIAFNPAAYGHVSVVVPERDELTLTLDVAGTRVGLAHGHQIRPGKAQTWWAEQAHGMQPIGDATLLLTAHFHHLRLEQGGPKTWIQVPAFESESTWWRHQHGQVAPTGAVTAVVGAGGWRSLEVV